MIINSAPWALFMSFVFNICSSRLPSSFQNNVWSDINFDRVYAASPCMTAGRASVLPQSWAGWSRYRKWMDGWGSLGACHLNLEVGISEFPVAKFNWTCKWNLVSLDARSFLALCYNFWGKKNAALHTEITVVSLTCACSCPFVRPQPSPYTFITTYCLHMHVACIWIFKGMPVNTWKRK